MTATSSVHSNALSFMSFMQNGVDPRTGQYTIAINLPELKANGLQGPAFKLALTYNPLNKQDSGFGLGWNVQLSQYTPHNQVISLSTGESFKVTGSRVIERGTERVTELLMKEKKLDSFHFYRIDDDDKEGPGTRFRVVHRSGQVEILQVMGASENRVALPVQVSGATGHSLSLSYQPFDNRFNRLASISDDSGELLSIERTSAVVTVHCNPGQAGDGGALARFDMFLEGTERRVARIDLPTHDKASWRFKYRRVLEHDCLERVDTPTGAREHLYYTDDGHAFPGVRDRKLPRVTQHVTYPGHGQPSVDVRYTYGANTHNFLGNTLDIAWADDGLDNLYKYVGEYRYSSEESLWVTDGAEGGTPQPRKVRSTERTFNQFHLLTEEKTTQGNSVQTVTTEYNLTAFAPFEQQANNCQLPTKVITRWSLLNDASQTRVETTSSRYDTHGNLLTHTLANGVLETSTWYPAAGADGCPANPEGFVCHLKDKTTTPAASQAGPAPVQRQRYRYISLPALTQSGLAAWHAIESETYIEVLPARQAVQANLTALLGAHLAGLLMPFVAPLAIDIEATTELELQRTTFDYTNTPADAFAHGRLRQSRITLNGQATTTDFTYAHQARGTHAQEPVLWTEETVTGHTGTSKTLSQEQSLLTGLRLWDRDENGVETTVVHDALRRVVTETVAPGTEHEASRQYQYTLCANEGDQATQTVINARSVTTQTLLDGLGRAVREQRDHVLEASPQLFCKTLELAYNALGQKVTETHLDWLQSNEPMSLKSTFVFDDWGLPYSTLGPDGVELYQVLNPLGTPEHRGPILRSWRQSTGTTPQISGMSETWLNLFEKPVQVRRLGADQSLTASRSFTYDGLGRCLRQTDERGNSSAFSYDAWGRMLTSTLPDKTVLERAYATHSSADLPVSLSVTPANSALPKRVVGTQVFDGLDQLTEVCTGGRRETYVYTPGQSRAAQKITAAGEKINYTYQLNLTDEPETSSAVDENATFEYHPQSANLTYASNENGSREYDYNQANQLTAEHWTDPSGTRRSTHHASSLQDRLLSRTDDAGKVTAHTYDAQGRLSITTQGQVTVTQTYDPLSRARQTTTQDPSNNSTLVTTVDYDDHDQEIKRTLKLDNTPERVVVQTWLKDGLLERRTLSEGGTTLLDETFLYDPRGRLIRHACTGTELPKDALGREITAQVFRLDDYDNITLTATTFADRTTEQARFTYTNAEDPCQLTGITYTPKRATADPTFSYDANGNQLNDAQGRSLSYDSQGRLLAVHDSSAKALGQYQYDSHGDLFGARLGTDDERLLMYDGDRLSLAIHGALRTQYLYQGGEPVAEQRSDGQSNTLLLQANASGSVIAESQQGTLRSARFSAYGERTADPAMRGGLGLNGEVLDPASGCYLLGRGYRAYDPEIKRFRSPDSLSPFGSGGLNSYGYCLGNPITLRDPTGHSAIGWSGRLRAPDEDVIPGLGGGGGSSVMPWVYLGIGVIFTAAAIFTAGAAVAGLAGAMAAASVGEVAAAAAVGALQTKAIIATTIAALSVSATIAQGVAVGGSNETAGKVAEYIGFATIALTAGAALYKGVPKVLSLVKRLVRKAPKVKPNLLATTSGEWLDSNTSPSTPTEAPKNPSGGALILEARRAFFSKQNDQLSDLTLPTPLTNPVSQLLDRTNNVMGPQVRST